MHPLHDIAGEGPLALANPYHDVQILHRHQREGGDLDRVLYLSLGETWSEVAPGLAHALRTSVPRHSHGYILTPYGLPALRDVLRSYITDSHRLAGVAELGVDYDVAVSQASTRNSMFHFGRLLREEATGTGRPIVVCASPGWDYAGVYGALGYQVHHFAVRPEAQYQPPVPEVEHVLRRARAATAGPILLVLNPQHNPTGAHWSRSTVRRMARAALEVGAAILIDDAYYAVHAPEVQPTSALRILLEELALLGRDQPRPRWMAVRSLGKQFHANGWGLGAVTASILVLEELFCRLLPQYSYVTAVPLQAAMATWLTDEESEAFLAQQRASYAQKRREVTKRLTDDLHYPADAFSAGSCGPYLLMRIPPWIDETKESYRETCLRHTGVLLGEAHMTTPGNIVQNGHGYVRLFLGPQLDVITEALEQMTQAGLSWRGTVGQYVADF